MTRTSLPETAHQFILDRLQSGDIAIDATCGNGHDTFFLAQQVGNTGHVYGFDIQSQAIESTKKRLKDAGIMPTATLFQISHADMAEHIPRKYHGNITAIMFNLGYLPGSDKSLITRTKSTLPALNAATDLLAENGLLTILAYPGHPGGDEEAKEVEHWLDQLDHQHFNCSTVYSKVNKTSSPRLHIIIKS